MWIIDWRNKPVTKVCKCGVTFTGKYNSRKCNNCKTRVIKKSFLAFQARNPEYWKKWSQKRRDAGFRDGLRVRGISQKFWDELALKQNHLCAICGKKDGWKANAGLLVVDHNHETGKIRGLLCPSCNRGLGQFEDKKENLFKAAEYLKRDD